MPTRAPLGAAVAAVLLLPGDAHAATLTPLKACYVTSTDEVQRRDPARAGPDRRQRLHPRRARRHLARRDARSGRSRPTRPATSPPQALEAPYRRKGQRAFRLTATDQANPANTVEAVSNVTALRRQHHAPRRPRRRAACASAGAGSPQPGTVYGHYLYRGKVRKTVTAREAAERALRHVLSVKRKQIPISSPRLGQWRLQIDQEKKYRRAPERGRSGSIIRVQRVFKPSR